MDEMETLLRQAEDATTAVDLYGPATPDAAARRRARRTHRRLALHLHPDRLTTSPGVERARAAAAFARAAELYDAWQRAAGAAGAGAGPAGGAASVGVVLTGARGRYRLGAELARGTVATVLAAEALDGVRGDVPGPGPVVVKIGRNATSARFLRNERAALAALGETVRSGQGWLAPYLPRLLDTATIELAGGGAAGRAGGAAVGTAGGGTATAGRREANVLGALGRAQGFVTLSQVRAAVPAGLDGRDWAWMQRRLLRALAAVHATGLVHGALLPENVLVHPRQHGVVIAGWSFATRPGRRAEGVVRSRAAAYPPEALDRDGVVTPATDVAMLGTLALTMLRDGPGERAQRRFAAGCTQAAPRMRPRAADLLGEYDELLERLHGPRRFRPFEVAVRARRPDRLTD